MAYFLRMRLLLLAGCVLLASADLSAQRTVWQPPPGHTQLPLWPGAAPDAQPTRPEEVATTSSDELVAGKPYTYISNVSRPTITVYSPAAANTGAAVVVFPGGGYQILAIDLEGTEVCDWLVSKGITCVLLKYRVPGLSFYPKPAYPQSGPYPQSPIALEDAQRAVRLVRFHAQQWHIDPHKIGVLGFSAGGHMVAAISTHFDKRLYPAVDAADQESCRPDFGLALYPGHMLKRSPRGLGLTPTIPVTRQTPPIFLVQAKDDPVDSVQNSIVFFAALRKAKVPAEMHLFAHGGHAFGLRRTKLPITGWPELAERWLRLIGMSAQ